ncbi:MAG: YciI family protein [Candidatus Binatus sp.]
MEYMLLIYGSEAEGKKRSEAEGQQLFQEYMTFTQDLTKSGKNKGGAPLEPSATATTVRVRNGKTAVTDGPFAETKEQLGGYYLVEAKDLDEAISIAARIPGAKHGSIEVRPVMKINM